MTKECGRPKDDGDHRIIIVAGPTASGKSALALALAERLDGVLINADAMQVYRDLRILTARPSAAEEALAPHRLYGVLDGTERCSAARWRALANDEIAAAKERGRRAIIVGGTGLYLRVLMHGIAPIPDVPPRIRQAAAALYDDIGGPVFQRRLAAVDPAAARLAPGDRQRLIRALEVHQATGRSLTEWQRAQPSASGSPCVVFTLLPPRQELYQTCDTRFVTMVEQGALEEVETLAKLDLAPTLPIMKAVGVRELQGCLRGDWSEAEAIRRGQQATRRYAKRQYTWFRHQLTGAHVIEEKFSNRIMPEILSNIS